MTPEEIARHFHTQGQEVTPNEVRDMLKSVAAKFRAVCPELPDDDDELFKIVLASIK